MVSKSMLPSIPQLQIFQTHHFVDRTEGHSSVSKASPEETCGSSGGHIAYQEVPSLKVIILFENGLVLKGLWSLR